MLSPRVRPMGERAFLLEVGALDDVLPLHAALAATRPEGVVDLVPAARTVLVRVDTRRLPLDAARAWALGAAAGAEPGGGAAGPLVELDIVYDGADLAGTADLLGTGADELVRRHAAAEWRVAFTGFAPGFGYLVSEDWHFDVPRLDSPRTRVPAGAVGLAGAFSGAYPRDTPGGWRLIGTTAARLFDPDAASPALLAPGTRVRFRPVAAIRPVAVVGPGAAFRSGDATGGDAAALDAPRPRAPLTSRAVRAGPAASASSNRACSPPCRISGARERHPSASPYRGHSTAAPCARPTACSATPRVRRPSR